MHWIHAKITAIEISQSCSTDYFIKSTGLLGHFNTPLFHLSIVILVRGFRTQLADYFVKNKYAQF